MKIYKFYSIRNLAETWRDPDKIVYGDEYYTSSIMEIERYALNFLKENYPYYDLPKNIELNDKGEWNFDIFGSWMPTYYIKEIEVLGGVATNSRHNKKPHIR